MDVFLDFNGFVLGASVKRGAIMPKWFYLVIFILQMIVSALAFYVNLID